ncbi:carbon-nitrogen hydrolase [Apiosordaria backusii]|uniref:Carbon-nitrogen hydrolase n=1 Tax=Apiosordaria backusii TaxID=314023 RepID=A0AA40BN24_9PEZI|nr:carbon-nitrogen hydrolase [Apiosordaria backusii]
MSPTTIRLGTASPSTQATTPETIAQLEHITRRAASKKIDVLLLPEAYIGGYPRGTHFGCVIGSRTAEGREEYLRYFQNAVDLGDTVGDGAGAGEAWIKRTLPSDVVPGPNETVKAPAVNKRGDGTREQLERIARETGVFIVTGLIEKAGGSMYCSVVYVCPKQGIIGKRRKVMPTGTERLVWAQGSPSTLRAVSTTIRGVRINLAAAICWENYMPLVRQSLYSQNINLYLAPTADGRDTWLSLMRTVAIEGRCFVISSNMAVPPASATADTSIANQANGYSHPNDSSAITEEPDHDDDNASTVFSDPSPFAPKHHSNRRASCLTEEGFEIALPRPKSPGGAATTSSTNRSTPSPTRTTTSTVNTFTPSSKRRTSIFDEDGNEIVLCCKKPSHATSSSSQPMAPPPRAFSQSGPRREGLAGSGEWICKGGSSIISPFGEVLSGPQWEDNQGIIYTDVDFEDCIRGRLDLDTAGSYSRNDSFEFRVKGLDLSPLPY